MTNKQNVLKLQCPFERIKKYDRNPISSLYKAVIMQMIIDASNISTNKKEAKLANRAKAWLFEDNEDFFVACSVACITPETARRTARELIEIHYERVRKKAAVRASSHAFST